MSDSSTDSPHREPEGDLAARLTFVGVGPGNPDLLTRCAVELLSSADVAVVDRDVHQDVLALLGGNATVEHPEGSPVAVAETLGDRLAAGGHVVRLVSGDPWSRDGVIREAALLAEAGVRFEVVPGISLGAGAAAYAGVALGQTHVEVDIRSEATASGHPDVSSKSVDWAALASAPGTLSVTVSGDQLGKTATALMEHGLAGVTPVVVVDRATLARESSRATTLEQVETLETSEGPLVLLLGAGLETREALAWSENRPLYGWTVLVPRTREQAGSMSALLRRYGALPLEVPTISVEKPRLPTHMERAVKNLVDGEFEWVVFTSANAVRAVREKFVEFGLDARALSGVKVAVVGDATAAAVRSYGIEPELIPSGEQSGRGLLEDFPPYDETLDPVSGVLLPRADIATETLATGLAELGWEVRDVTAYRTVRAAPPPAEIREAIKGGGFDAVLFTSSSTARNLVGIAGKPHARTVVACIGPKTSETAGELGLKVDVMPSVANVPALVAALASYAQQIAETGKRPQAGPAARPAAKEPPLP